MKCRLAAVLAALLLTACATGPTYMGYPVRMVPFKVDGGHIALLPMTRMGPPPAESPDYKIDGAGFYCEMQKGDPQRSLLTWAFSFKTKYDDPIVAVTVERVTDAGDLQPLVQDNAPVIKNHSWMGHAVSVPMTRSAIPWMYTESDTMMLFKFTIRAKGREPEVMYQPSMVSSESKQLDMKVLGIN